MPTPHFWPAFVNPTRATEAVHWIKRHPQETRDARGEYGETALHWGALSVPSLLVDLVDLGIPINSLDRTGKSPQDWQNDRLFTICVARERQMSEGGRQRVLNESKWMIQALWRLGGRPGMACPVDPLQVWIRAGAWELLDMRVDMGDMKWRGLGDQGESVLHGWTVAPDTSEKRARLPRLIAQGGLSVDEPNAAGQSPLWVAVDGWIARPAWSKVFASAIDQLLAHGADPARPDREGVSAQALVLAAEDLPRADQEALRQRLGLAV